MTNWKIFAICAVIGFAICIGMFTGYRTYISHKQHNKQVLIQQANMKMQERIQKELWGKVCHYASPEYNQAVANGTLGKYPGEITVTPNEGRPSEEGASQASIK